MQNHRPETLKRPSRSLCSSLCGVFSLCAPIAVPDARDAALAIAII
ncbi:hypothetical protein [Desulfocurvus sp. DL9XJH121]